MSELNNKVAVITGAGSGIGEAIAKALSQHGVNIALAGRNEEKLHTVAQQLETETKVIPTDVTQKDSVDQMLQVVKGHYGKVDIVVNSAGQSLSSKITDYDVEQWDTMIDVNLKGTLYVLQAALPHLLNQSCGHIINIASISGFEVTKTNAVYSATKTAIHTITQALEKELARTGVKVTSVSPGMVETSMTEGNDFGGRKKLDTRDIAEAVVYALTQPSHVNVNEVTVRPV